MDIRAAIRRDTMASMLRKFARDANAIGAKPEEATALLLDLAAVIYAVKLSGAVTDRERKRAKAAFIRSVEQAVAELPMRDVDRAIEAKLKAQGF